MTSGSDRSPRLKVGAPARDMAAPLPSALSWTVLGAFVVAFLLAYFLVDLPLWIPALYLVMSIVAFAAYGVDKSAAKANRRRTSEQALLMLGLLCGWPGALVAQQVLRHKTRKRSFRRMFWLTVVLNVEMLGGVIYVAATESGLLDLPFLAALGQI